MTPGIGHGFAGAEELAEALATRVADALAQGVTARGEASLAVSGGSTPGRFLDALSRRAIVWDRIAVTLVDDRFVPPDHERSNERLVRERLLSGHAAAARFVPLHAPCSLAEASDIADAAVAAMPQPFDAVVLGMGTDGHTASFFADATQFEAVTDKGCARHVMAIEAASAGEPRLTLTMPVIVAARLLVLHIEGDEKRHVLQQAMRSDGARLPIRIVADAAPQLEVYWAP